MKKCLLIRGEWIKLRNRIPNETIRTRTKVTDAIESITRLKWNWAGQGSLMVEEQTRLSSGAAEVMRPEASMPQQDGQIISGV